MPLIGLAVGLAFALGVASTVTAQLIGTPYRIGLLSAQSAAPNRAVEALREGLKALGWVEGQSLLIEARFADGHPERLTGLAMDLVRSEVQVIVAGPSTVAQAARRVTATIPIVMAGVGDPIKLGFIDSLSHPGGNVTGLAMPRPELEAKSFRLLAELVPGLNRIAVLLNPDNPLHDVKDAEAAAKRAGVQVMVARARKLEEFPAAFATMVKAQVGALSIWEDPVFSRYRASLVDLAMRSRLPSMFKSSADAAAGGLVAYGLDSVDLHRRAASYVDKILKGAQPGDLPVEQPTKFELVINLKTATALGLTIPPSILTRANQVIE